MSTASDPARHTPLAIVETYFEGGLSGGFGIDGEPTGQLIADPAHRSLGLRFPTQTRRVDTTAFEHLAFRVIEDGGSTWDEIAIALDDNIDEVYALLCSIADRVQLAGEDFVDAITEALDSLTGILALRRGLTHDRQVGLVGELLAFGALVSELGPSDAVAAWRGPLGEEHDFGTSTADVEVKSTTSERRAHWISSVSQLATTGTRPLYLLSVQLTRAGVASGATLPQLVATTRAAVGLELGRFDSVIDLIGYRNRDADLYRERWALRTAPAFFEIDSVFPAITPERLTSAVPSAERVSDLRYRVDLSGLTPATPPFSVDAEIPQGAP